jgi:hypothetical protein
MSTKNKIKFGVQQLKKKIGCCNYYIIPTANIANIYKKRMSNINENYLSSI